MRRFDFTAKATVALRVVADCEDDARSMIQDLLHDADTDFVRSRHWPLESIVAEFSLSDVTRKGTAQ